MWSLIKTSIRQKTIVINQNEDYVIYRSILQYSKYNPYSSKFEQF